MRGAEPADQRCVALDALHAHDGRDVGFGRRLNLDRANLASSRGLPNTQGSRTAESVRAESAGVGVGEQVARCAAPGQGDTEQRADLYGNVMA